jgi:two-component system chemotaxis sensor kinase CheA
LWVGDATASPELERARRIGLPAATSVDLVRALFVDAISTSTTMTDVSGRGVGMGALLAATLELGGELNVQSVANTGTTLRFTFQSAMIRSDAPPPTTALN